MVFSYYISKCPYKLAWKILKFFGKTEKVVFYCGNEMDIIIFEPVQKYLKSIPIVVKNKKIQKRLKDIGIQSRCLPCFPEAVITCRQAAYRFPEEKILKFGFRHGPYHFKPFANTKSYNMNTMFFMTSTHEVQEAKKAGIECGVAIGYPKLDAAFDGTLKKEDLDSIRKMGDIDPLKKTILFTATWDKSGISAVDRWYNRLNEFTDNYNVFVTIHPSCSVKYKKQIQQTKGVYFISDNNVVPYIILADLCIGDSSSILAECCALKKPVITFKVPDGKRMVPEVKEIIESISMQIDTVDELDHAIAYMLDHPQEKIKQMEKANRLMFDSLDGHAGKRAAEAILDYLPELRL